MVGIPTGGNIPATNPGTIPGIRFGAIPGGTPGGAAVCGVGVGSSLGVGRIAEGGGFADGDPILLPLSAAAAASAAALVLAVTAFIANSFFFTSASLAAVKLDGSSPPAAGAGFELVSACVGSEGD